MSNYKTPTMSTTVHIDDDTPFKMTVTGYPDTDASVLHISFNDSPVSGFKFFFKGDPQKVVLMLTGLVRELKREHGIVSSDEYDGITESDSLAESFEAHGLSIN